MQRPLVYIVILSYNSARWLEACLTSVFATDYPNFKVVVVDNASTDSSVAEIRKFLPQVEWRLNQENLGFAAGNNIGIAQALSRQADYVVLLNPDTKVTPGWLTAMIEVAEAETGIGIIGAVQYSYHDETFNSWTQSALTNFLAELAMLPAGLVWLPMEWVEGSCFLVKQEVFQRIGLLDPIYISFYEEIDFCRRAACSGYRTALAVNSRVHHYRGGSWVEDGNRMRDYFCDRGQFIYALTDPRRSFPGNLKWYFITLLTKLREVLKHPNLKRFWHLLAIQAELLGKWPGIYGKWRRERQAATF